jgi:transposase-like protein
MTEKVHSDNGAGILNVVKTLFPDSTILTCIFHMKNNFKKKLIILGLKNRSALNYYLDTINGLLYCDLKF